MRVFVAVRAEIVFGVDAERADTVFVCRAVVFFAVLVGAVTERDTTERDVFVVREFADWRFNVFIASGREIEFDVRTAALDAPMQQKTTRENVRKIFLIPLLFNNNIKNKIF